MAILTYKEAALKLKISLDRLMRYIERPEFAQFRCEAYSKVEKRYRKGGMVQYIIPCRGVNYTRQFVELFFKITGRRKKYGN